MELIFSSSHLFQNDYTNANQELLSLVQMNTRKCLVLHDLKSKSRNFQSRLAEHDEIVSYCFSLFCIHWFIVY